MKFVTLKYFLSTIVFAASVCVMNSQDLVNSHWHFGDGIGLFHDGSALVSTASSIATMNGVSPASISSESGDLMFYSNGQTVWNANHEVIENGTFSNLGLNNIFCPVPGNPDQYYLFRSAEWGVDYSIVDASLNGGEGAIVTDEKEVFIQNHKSELLIAHKAGTFNFWLLVIENSTGGSTINIQSYEVSDIDVTQEQTFSAPYTWAGWYSEVDDAKLSPDCSKISVLHKGHYLTLYEFDNEDGTVFNNLPNAVDTQTSFTTRCNMEFAPGSEYIYVIGDFNRIDRFSLSTWTQAAINASQTNIAQANFGSNTWRDIKLGPYGDLYVYNEVDGTIESVIDPDVVGNETGLEYAEMDIETTSYFFPNTPNMSCASVAFPSFMAEGFCVGDTTWLSFEIDLQVDDLNWDFGSNEAIFATTDNNPNWVIYPDQGTYDVTLELFFNGTWHEYIFPISIGTEPQVDLGDDVTLCQGESVTFSVPNQELYQINWSTGAQTAEIEVSTSGNYGVVVNNMGCIAGDTVQVFEIPALNVSLENYFFCDEGQAVLDATHPAAENYLWSTGSTEPVITVDNAGTYWVELSNNCFSVTDTSVVEIVVFPDPLLPGDVQACLGDTVFLNSGYQSGNIFWNTGDVTGEIAVTESGVYSVFIDDQGCTASDETVVDFQNYYPLDELEMPNVFTPNSDRDNPIFRPYSPEDRELQLCGTSWFDADITIYNRWGVEIHKDVCFWDGKSRSGEIMHDGTYFYLVDLSVRCYERDENRQLSGYVTLLR